MTDFVEQMMETAGCKRRIPECFECFVNRIERMRTIDECPRLYPSFTAEKQLEAIKLISDFRLYTMEDGTYDIRGQYIEVTDTKGDFPQALAQLTIKLMNAGKLDKEKVRGILQC